MYLLYSFSGLKGSGKDTMATEIEKVLDLNGFYCFRISFAELLKKICLQLLKFCCPDVVGVFMEDGRIAIGVEDVFFNEKKKDRPFVYKRGDNHIKMRRGEVYISPRLWMQTIGTDILIGTLGQTLFADNVLKKIEAEASLFGMIRKDKIGMAVLVTDLRFTWEDEMLKNFVEKEKGIRNWVWNKIYMMPKFPATEEDKHLSERMYRLISFNQTILSDFTHETYRQACERFRLIAIEMLKQTIFMVLEDVDVMELGGKEEGEEGSEEGLEEDEDAFLVSLFG